MVDRNGNVVNNYEYDEWGNIRVCNETISNPFKYAGEIFDQETGLYYLRARYYDPSMGRFINEDSYEGQVNNPLTLNLYSYCYSNPLVFSDPSGHVASPILPLLPFLGPLFEPLVKPFQPNDVLKDEINIAINKFNKKVKTAMGEVNKHVIASTLIIATVTIAEVKKVTSDEGAGNSNGKSVTDSAGNEVERGLVQNQDELLGAAEDAAGGSLDDWTEVKPSWWVSPDGDTKIEWEPAGHANTNEGPHVTVRVKVNGKWKVTEKIFIDGKETYK